MDIAVEAVAPLATQVGGHRSADDSKAAKGMLQIGHGQTAARVLKPLEDGGRAVRELAFYRAVFPEIAVPPLGDLTPPQPPQFPGPDDDKARLRALVPAFYGVVHVPLEPDTPPHHIRFLSLEDLCSGHELPCVMDVKLGTRTYDPFAAASKVAKEVAKYPWQAQLGFRITGMQVYRPTPPPSGGSDGPALPRPPPSLVRHDRFYGRSLAPETVLDGVKTFFCADMDADAVDRAHLAAVASEVARQLADVHQWCVAQRTFRFFSSSVLIAYDGAARPLSASSVRVRLIDFAHAYAQHDAAVAAAVASDDGYALGLDTLTHLVRQVHAVMGDPESEAAG